MTADEELVVPAATPGPESRTVTLCPRWTSANAAEQPTIPAPMMMASDRSVMPLGPEGLDDWSTRSSAFRATRCFSARPPLHPARENCQRIADDEEEQEHAGKNRRRMAVAGGQLVVLHRLAGPLENLDHADQRGQCGGLDEVHDESDDGRDHSSAGLRKHHEPHNGCPLESESRRGLELGGGY